MGRDHLAQLVVGEVLVRGDRAEPPQGIWIGGQRGDVRSGVAGGRGVRAVERDAVLGDLRPELAGDLDVEVRWNGGAVAAVRLVGDRHGPDGDPLAVHQIFDYGRHIVDVGVHVLREEGAAAGAVVVELAWAAPDAEHQADVVPIQPPQHRPA
jgi:hypothetical protein